MIRHICAKSLLAGVFLISSFPANGQSSDPAWLDNLTQQLTIEKECEVAYYVNLQEYEKGGFMVFEARVQCVDGRQFDAQRQETDDKFRISDCGTLVC